MDKQDLNDDKFNEMAVSILSMIVVMANPQLLYFEGLKIGRDSKIKDSYKEA